MPPLVCGNCKTGKKKFGFVFEKILLPLALEYHPRSRADEITDAATTQLAALNSGDSDRIQDAQIAIAGRYRNMRELFASYLPSSPLTVNQVKSAINTLNLVRLSKIKNLLDFVKQQGLAYQSMTFSSSPDLDRIRIRTFAQRSRLCRARLCSNLSLLAF